ncbi:response regulator transcription factor [Coraliomargarita sp. SDUM461003]|uniref:Response regulator transcription factor n=1 Tax=Thalassobacterium maritimum TaxID=3041265 RepID=A0ABU1APP7_9BACT|nr:response regulator transcription factor [Coraliomargarita sp. SDUM461003]MDQ8206144.1 response regulator transcription factor [Coraliomargarita sp. SDUM461003]
MAYRTLLIEDHRLFLNLLANHIEQSEDFALVGQATDGEMGLACYLELQPDLVLLDIVIPKLNGLELAKQILKHDPQARLLAITSQMDEQTTTQIHDIGFQGYVEKEQPIETLQEAMLTVAEGGLYYTKLVRENRYKIASDPNALHKILSPREQEILYWVGEGLTSQSISDTLKLSPRTVENHRYRIMKKLNIESTSELIKLVLKHRIQLP